MCVSEVFLPFSGGGLLVGLQWHINQNKIVVDFLWITFYSLEEVTSLLREKLCFFLSLLQSLRNLLCLTRLELKAWSPHKS